MRELASYLGAQLTYLAVDEPTIGEINPETGQNIATNIVTFFRPLLIVGVVAIAAYFAFQKQFSKVWTVIIIGAVVFALTIGSGDSSIIGQLAYFLTNLFN